MSIQLTPMDISDYEEVIALWRSTEGIGLSAADTRDGILLFLRRNPELSHIARVGDTVVGAVLCGHDGRRGYLHHLAVSSQYRGHGIGQALVRLCLAGLGEAGIRKCNIFVYADNAAGQTFWRHAGWVGRFDLLVMQTMTGDVER